MRPARLVEGNFLGIALAGAALALAEPALFTWIAPHIPLLLGVIMFGMGLTLTPADFAAAARKWRLGLLGVALQYTLMPLLALLAARLFSLPLEAALGLVVVGACPGGTASNVIAYLARADVALSVSMTLASTALAPLATPWAVELAFGRTIDVPVSAMAASVFWIVVFPLVDGLVVRRLLRRRLEPVLAVFPCVSILVIAAIIACVVGLNRATILAFPLAVAAAVTLHNLAGFAAGYWGARLFGAGSRGARTVSIEVGMQNSGLGVALATAHFGAAAALPGALFSLEQNLAGIVLARWWRKRAAQ